MAAEGVAAASAASVTASSSSWPAAAAPGARRMTVVAHGVTAPAMVVAMAMAPRAVAEGAPGMVAGEAEIRVVSERYRPVAAIR